MNALNLLTMLSGSIGKENFSRLFQGEDKAAGDFSATLMAQIGLLAQPESQENLTLPMTGLAELTEQLTHLASFDSEQMSSTMQEIAGLLGNKLPASGHFDQEIDLEKTMKTLSEVLAHIEAATELLTHPTSMSGNADRAETDEATVPDLSAVDNTQAMSVTMMPLNIINNPDETILSVDANTKLPLDDQGDTGITDGEGNIPKLIKNILQNGEELSNGKSLIEEQRLAGENKASTDGKVVDLHAKADSKTASIEKKLAPSTVVEKPVPKMALDMAQLHRQIAGQTKIEVPAMSKPMMHPEWDQELGERIVWMNNRAMPFAELRLNPQHLGPISIRIDMNQDQATIAFSAQQAAVKEAIEAAIPRLREMMSAQQLNVTEINVTQASLSEQAKLSGLGQATQQQNEGGQKNGRGTNVFKNSDNTITTSENADSANAIISSGLLNIFA